MRPIVWEDRPHESLFRSFGRQALGDASLPTCRHGQRGFDSPFHEVSDLISSCGDSYADVSYACGSPSCGLFFSFRLAYYEIFKRLNFVSVPVGIISHLP